MVFFSSKFFIYQLDGPYNLSFLFDNFRFYGSYLLGVFVKKEVEMLLLLEMISALILFERGVLKRDKRQMIGGSVLGLPGVLIILLI